MTEKDTRSFERLGAALRASSTRRSGLSSSSRLLLAFFGQAERPHRLPVVSSTLFQSTIAGHPNLRSKRN
jgi:hypothetical protein